MPPWLRLWSAACAGVICDIHNTSFQVWKLLYSMWSVGWKVGRERRPKSYSFRDPSINPPTLDAFDFRFATVVVETTRGLRHVRTGPPLSAPVVST